MTKQGQQQVQFIDPIGNDCTSTGRIVSDERRYAWTPNDRTNVAPDAGMVRVLWDGDREPMWEYEASLAAAS